MRKRRMRSKRVKSIYHYEIIMIMSQVSGETFHSCPKAV